MHKGAIVAASAFAILLTACGSDPAPDPVEQIKVREPGQPEKSNPLPTREPGAPPIPSAVGERAFAVCSGCHLAEKDEPSGAGPNLFGVVGRKAASLDDFTYSDALKASEITWTEAELDAFIANPTGKVPGTSMAAGAVSDADTRAAIIAYLETLNE